MTQVLKMAVIGDEDHEMIPRMCKHKRLHELTGEKVGVAPLREKVRKVRLSWFGHINKRGIDVLNEEE